MNSFFLLPLITAEDTLLVVDDRGRSTLDRDVSLLMLCCSFCFCHALLFTWGGVSRPGPATNGTCTPMKSTTAIRARAMEAAAAADAHATTDCAASSTVYYSDYYALISNLQATPPALSAVFCQQLLLLLLLLHDATAAAAAAAATHPPAVSFSVNCGDVLLR
jgi:hypothetical protein